ncbi:DNA-binding transcriptional regulator, GntR family [Devosia enhydra]|uniref:DNA-binding transcriptional regulator, GntR family n=1 Tax=Devosia enhydra TaxID=665118 RepID=A0A1K2HV67_9HYPH|nr:GntR family transcriptional regulator [Devosia enhydra]SFZ82588.1 DNA-binding transcriptional regulator, GntR family [Devosia enhydra]
MNSLPTRPDLPQPLRRSLSESVADTIAEAISTRALAPGARLVETTLVEKLGVSRVPVREALKVLHAQGIISGGGHRGYRVTAFDPQVTQQVMEVRLSLESYLLRDAIINWRNGTEKLDALEPAIERMRASAAAGSIRNSLVADLEFHRAIRKAANNAIVGTLWDTISRHVLIVFNYERFRDGNLEAIPRQHEELRDWIVSEIAKPETSMTAIEQALEDHMLLIARKTEQALSLTR